MIKRKPIEIHGNWEDWALAALGVLTLLSPLVAGETVAQAVMLNAVIVGVLLICLGVMEMVRLHRLEEVAVFIFGLWLLASPFGYGYGGALAAWHFVIGLLVLTLGVFQLWQDWDLSDKDMKRHNR